MQAWIRHNRCATATKSTGELYCVNVDLEHAAFKAAEPARCCEMKRKYNIFCRRRRRKPDPYRHTTVISLFPTALLGSAFSCCEKSQTCQAAQVCTAMSVYRAKRINHRWQDLFLSSVAVILPWHADWFACNVLCCARCLNSICTPVTTTIRFFVTMSPAQ